MAATKKQRFNFSGIIKEDSLVVGSHGDALINIAGEFDISGLIYCPKYTITVAISGDGVVAFRGKCSRVVIKRMEGNCTLDLTDLTCTELRCESASGQAKIISGKIRVLTQANLADEAVLHLAERPLITSSYTSGSSQIIRRKPVTE